MLHRSVAATSGRPAAVRMDMPHEFLGDGILPALNDSGVMSALDARQWQRKNGVGWCWSETPEQRRKET